MPIAGGPATRLGNRYETLWVIDLLIKIVHGQYSCLTLEPIAPSESKGIEYTALDNTGAIEYWSIKRQTTKASGWTLALLSAKDNTGRSILGDLLEHVERAQVHKAVFASIMAAHDFEELRAHASTKEIFYARLALAGLLNSKFQEHLVPLCGGDPERARTFLNRSRTHAIDEHRLREDISFAIRQIFHKSDGTTLDVTAVSGHLTDLLNDHIHIPINRDDILNVLIPYGIALRDWAQEPSIRGRIAELCENYLSPLRDRFIGGHVMPLPGSEQILNAEGRLSRPNILVVGGAGGGKSSILADVVTRNIAVGIPVLPVRFDLLPEGILTTMELGRRLGLPESPVLVLAGIADGNPCVLVVDQLDAVSMASGRRTDLWELFEIMRREALRYPGMCVILGCREFDLEHDPRMRTMKAAESGFALVELKPFTVNQVDAVLGNSQNICAGLKQILRIPLHLSMFMSLPPLDRGLLQNRDDLFEHFWTIKELQAERRLGRPPAWAHIIGKLSFWLSEHQQLSAPSFVLDDCIASDVNAMTSENVIILADKRYGFFHESFFDYAFARQFVGNCLNLTDLLSGSEQHLFRRGQVRQVLTYLRSHERNRYLSELEAVIVHKKVRFHIKRVVFQWLSSMPDPTHQEWGILQRLRGLDHNMVRPVGLIVANHTAWFDVLDHCGFFEDALKSGDVVREEETIWLMGLHTVLENRSERISTILLTHRRNEEKWNRYLRLIFRGGDAYYSDNILTFFLSLIDDGTLDELMPEGAWIFLESMINKRPDMSCAVIARWFSRSLSKWRNAQFQQPALKNTPKSNDPRQIAPTSFAKYPHDISSFPTFTGRVTNLSKSYCQCVAKRILDICEGAHQWFVRIFMRTQADKPSAIANPLATMTLLNEPLFQYLGRTGDGNCIIRAAAGAPLAYIENLLPLVAQYIEVESKDYADCLMQDPLWSTRTFGSDSQQSHTAIFAGLAQALEKVAATLPSDLARLLTPYLARPHDSMAYLILRSWSAAPNLYANQLAEYLVADPRRLKVGYSGWNARGGNARNYISIQAVRSATSICSNAQFAQLENSILSLEDAEENGKPRFRGQRQFELLDAFANARLSRRGIARLDELSMKFKTAQIKPPIKMETYSAGKAIPAASQEKMKDHHWLRAMEKYSGFARGAIQGRSLSANGHLLCLSIKDRAKRNPKQFMSMARLMPAHYSPTYYDAIIHGITECYVKGSIDPPIDHTEVISFFQHIHELPNRPCGLPLAWWISRWANYDWPDSVLDSIAWYANYDPDPPSDLGLPKDNDKNERPLQHDEPYRTGINSVRGSVAGALARMLFDRPDRFDRLSPSIESLAHDRSLAVRSCAIEALVASLNVNVQRAIIWFKECVQSNDALLGSPHAPYFLQYVGYRDFPAIRPIFEAMLQSDTLGHPEVAARLICLLALDNSFASEEAQKVRSGNEILRKAAADIYSANIADATVGESCLQYIKIYFSDPNESVRFSAVNAFCHISKMPELQQAVLLTTFLEASPDAVSLGKAIHLLGDSHVTLPDLVCRLLETSIKSFCSENVKVSREGIMVGTDLSKIAVRLYSQTDDATIQSRTLDVIDDMEMYGFVGIAEELQRVDR